MIEIREIDPIEYLGQAKGLAQSHADEIGLYFGYAPNSALIEQMHTAHVATTLGAFNNGELIGYAMMAFHESIHTGNHLNCQVMAIFVDKTQRKTTAGARLMARIQAIAKTRKCCAVNYHAPLGSALLRALERRYEPVETVFSIRI